mmetsp:Transcript_22452/g.37169  ORF Transcript_22452/g.37169 Transcript_22452/m.37169 type:complete len:249 (-) Transcript_22452:542-1288(-)
MDLDSEFPNEIHRVLLRNTQGGRGSRDGRLLHEHAGPRGRRAADGAAPPGQLQPGPRGARVRPRPRLVPRARAPRPGRLRRGGGGEHRHGVRLAVRGAGDRLLRGAHLRLRLGDALPGDGLLRRGRGHPAAPGRPPGRLQGGVPQRAPGEHGGTRDRPAVPAEHAGQEDGLRVPGGLPRRPVRRRRRRRAGVGVGTLGRLQPAVRRGGQLPRAPGGVPAQRRVPAGRGLQRQRQARHAEELRARPRQS